MTTVIGVLVDRDGYERVHKPFDAELFDYGVDTAVLGFKLPLPMAIEEVKDFIEDMEYRFGKYGWYSVNMYTIPQN
jgi:hypothetical protein